MVAAASSKLRIPLAFVCLSPAAFSSYAENNKHRRFFNLLGSNCFDSREGLNVPGETVPRQSRKFPMQLHLQKCLLFNLTLLHWRKGHRLPRRATDFSTWSFWTGDQRTIKQNWVTSKNKYLVPTRIIKALAPNCLWNKISSSNNFDHIILS